MKFSGFTLLFILTAPLNGWAQKKNILPREEHLNIIRELRTATGDGNVHLITAEDEEVPDPTRPLPVKMPDGSQKFILGFSGQNIMKVSSLEELTRGGVKRTEKVQLFNSFGFPYGGETDASGIPMGYSNDSSTWDVSLIRYKKTNGEDGLKVLAGAMGDGADGKPYLIKDGYNNTRQRLFFDAEFIGPTLHANAPKAILNSGVPQNGNWIQRNAQGKIIFSHGYGGEPVTLLNGDLFVDSRGWVPFVHETVVEQREEADANSPTGVRKIPYRTAIVMTYLDKTLSHVMQETKIIFDVYKAKNAVWAAARRPTAGPLVEGAHIEVQFQGKPVESMAEVTKILASGQKLDYEMLFSAGEFFGHYGSYMARSEGDLEHFKAVTDDKGELLDITAPLRVLFTWIGRPVTFYSNGKPYLILHGVDRTSLPRGITLDQVPRHHEWPHFRRQELVVPVERVMEKGQIFLKIKDNKGLIEKLKKFTPRPVSLRLSPELNLEYV